MISSLMFTMSAACFVALFFAPKPRQTCQSLETYYVCGPESHPDSEQNVASLAIAGESRD
jgi:hypothetical protein